MRRKTLIAAALLMSALCLKSNQCQSAELKKPITVGFSQIGAESAWRTAETESIRSEAAKRGVNLKFSDAQQKQENQIKALGTFIAQRVDAIILAPKVEDGWGPILKQAKAAKIPVVGKGSVVELQGTTGAAPAIDRKKGFEEALRNYPDMKISRSQSGDFNRAGGKQVMEAFLKAAQGSNTKIDAAYAHNDDMALGAIQAIEEAGLKPGSDIVVVSIDGVKGAFEAMVAGKLNCSVECNPLLGPAAFDAVEAVLAGKPLPKKTIVKDRLFDQSIAKDAIATRQY